MASELLVIYLPPPRYGYGYNYVAMPSFYLGAKNLYSGLHVYKAIARTLTHCSISLAQNVLFKHNFTLRIWPVL